GQVTLWGNGARGVVPLAPFVVSRRYSGARSSLGGDGNELGNDGLRNGDVVDHLVAIDLQAAQELAEDHLRPDGLHVRHLGGEREPMRVPRVEGILASLETDR